MPEITQRQQVQPDMMVGLMRYLPEFRGQPDEALKGYLYRLFNDSTFGTPEKRQQWQQNLMSSTWGTVQSVRSRNPSIFRDIPTQPSEFARTAQEQSRAYKPIPEWEKYGSLMVPGASTPFEKMSTEEKRYTRVIGELEQQYPGFGKELFYGVQTIKNLIGKHIAPLIAATAAPGAPDWYKNWAMRRVEGLTPELDFARQITRDYGAVAGFAYSFAEALPGIATSVGATRAALGILSATKIPMASAASRSLLSSPVAFNTAYWGGYSAGAYNQTMRELKKEPTVTGYGVNLLIGSAVGRMFPEAGKLFKQRKGAEYYVEKVLQPAMNRSIDDLRSMGRGQLVDVMKSKLFRPQEIQRGLTAIRYFKNPTKSLVKDYLGQSTKAGTMGAVSGAVGQLTAGLPIDFPSLVHNAAFMMAFHAWGPIGEKVGPRAKPLEKLELPDGTLKIGEKGHREVILDAMDMFIRKPDVKTEVGVTDFARRLKEAGVKKVEVSEGTFKDVDLFVKDFQAQTGEKAYKDALSEYAKAAAQFEFDPASFIREESIARARLDEIVAVLSRRAGENPNDLQSPIKNAAEKNVNAIEKNVTAKKSQEEIQKEIDRLMSSEDIMAEPELPPEVKKVNETVVKSKEHFVELRKKVGIDVKPKDVLQVGDYLYQKIEYPPEVKMPMQYNVFKVGSKLGAEVIPGHGAFSTLTAKEIAAAKLPVPLVEKKPVAEYVSKEQLHEAKPYRKKSAPEQVIYVDKSARGKVSVSAETGRGERVAYKYYDKEGKYLGTIRHGVLTAHWKRPKKVVVSRKAIVVGETKVAEGFKRVEDKLGELQTRKIEVKELEFNKLIERVDIELAELRDSAGNTQFVKEFTRRIRELRQESKKWYDKTFLEPKIEGVRINAPKEEAAIIKDDVAWAKMDVADKSSTVNSEPFRRYVYEAAKRFKIEVKGKSFDEIRYSVRQRILDDVYASTREKKDWPVAFVDGKDNGDFGFIVDIIRGKDDVKYKIRPYLGEKLVEVSWHNIERGGESLRKYYKEIEQTLRKMGVSGVKRQYILDQVFNGGVKLYGGLGAFEWIGKLLRQTGLGAKEKVRQEAILRSGFTERFAAGARMLREYRNTKDGVLAEVARVFVFGDPKSVSTPLQWQMIKEAVKYNRTNPHSMDPIKFIRASINRTNFEPGVVGHKSLTRKEARDVLQNYARISEAIRDRNWLVAMNVFLPSELKRFNPHINLSWDNMNKMEHRLNAMSVKGNETFEKISSWGLGDGQRVNTETLTPEFRKFSRKAYRIKDPEKEGRIVDLWKRWETHGRTEGEEVAGILHRIINPRKDKFVSQLAKRVAREIEKSGFREEWWFWFNRAVEQRLRMWGGKMFVDKNAFIKSYAKWKMEDARTTPENADAMFLKFSEEAADIHGNADLLKKTIDTMVDSKRLGKIVDAEQKNAFYPRFYEDHPQRLLEQLEGLERGELPSGRVGQFLSPHALRRRWDRVEGMASEKFHPDPMKDFASYMRNVSTFIWRNDVSFQLWAAKKRLMKDIITSPQHARVFQHHIEIVDKLRGDILTHSDKFIDNVSLGLGSLSAAVFLAHPGTVVRNFAGGHALTAIYNGLGWFSKGWRFRQTEEGQRILKQMGFEASSYWGYEQHPTRGRLAMEAEQKPGQKFTDTMNAVTGGIAKYALSHPIPFIFDWIPGASNLLKGVSFAGSEIHLRQVAFLAGYLRARESVMKGDREIRHKSRLHADTKDALIVKVRRKKIRDFDEHEIKLVKTKAGKEEYRYNYLTRETDADLATRAHRFGMDGGMNSIVMTQFIYSRLNMPTVMKHPLGRLILLFKRYTWNRVAFMNRVFKEAMPGRGGGPEELGRLMRFAMAMSGAMTLSSLINLNLYRFVEDDVVSMWGQVAEWLKTGEIRPYGRPVGQYLSGAFFGRLMDAVQVFEQGEVDWSRKITKLPVVPYGRYINDILTEQQKVAEGRKSIFDAIMNKVGFYYYNYDSGTRRERRGRRGR